MARGPRRDRPAGLRGTFKAAREIREKSRARRVLRRRPIPDPGIRAAAGKRRGGSGDAPRLLTIGLPGLACRRDEPPRPQPRARIRRTAPVVPPTDGQAGTVAFPRISDGFRRPVSETAVAGIPARGSSCLRRSVRTAGSRVPGCPLRTAVLLLKSSMKPPVPGWCLRLFLYIPPSHVIYR